MYKYTWPIKLILIMILINNILAVLDRHFSYAHNDFIICEGLDASLVCPRFKVLYYLSHTQSYRV